MHAVQSALAIRRERERRQSLKDNKPNNRKSSGASLPGQAAGSGASALPSGFRSSESSNGSFSYTTVGISFIIFGSLMLIPIMAGGSEMLGLDWHHLLGIGGLLIAVGVLMIVVHLLTEDESNVVEQTLEKYKAKVVRSASQNPIIEDVEYGVDSRRSSFANPPTVAIKVAPGIGGSESGSNANHPDIAKKFDQEPGGVVKV